jgi:hypothetical protein
MEALARTEGIIKHYERQKEKCMNELTAEETLSRNQLVEKVFMLQQVVADLRLQTQTHKEEYEQSIAEQLASMEELKAKALEALASKFFTYNQQ